MLSFVRPEYLWFLLALPLVWLLGWLNNRGRTGQRRWWALGLRTLLLLCLIGSLAGTQVRQPVQNLTTVFLLDSSDSIAPGQRSNNEQFIAQALETMQEGDKAAVVVFGENALVERVPSEIQRLGTIQSVPIAARTDISEAIQLGLALFPADTQKRLVLLSDGGENSGRALEMIPLAQRRNVPIDIVPTGIGQGNPEVAISAFRAPSAARSGQEIQLIATIESNTAQSAQLRWRADEQIVLEEAINLPVARVALPQRSLSTIKASIAIVPKLCQPAIRVPKIMWRLRWCKLVARPRCCWLKAKSAMQVRSSQHSKLPTLYQSLFQPLACPPI